MKKPTRAAALSPAVALALLLCLGLTACAPVAEVTPSPTPTETVTPNLRPGPRPTFAPVPKPTETPTPPPTPEPTPMLHEWSHSGYSYTSEALGIKINFPPEWEKYITFQEVQQKDFLYYYTDEDGFGAVAEEFTTVLYLMPTFESKYWPEESSWFARIFWEPAGTSDIASWWSGASVRLWESDAGEYTCWMDFMMQVELDGREDIEDRLSLAICESIQNGIIDGRWEIEVLEK